MNVPASHNTPHLLHWMAAALLFTGCAVVDAGFIAWRASILTLWEFGVVGFTYGLVAIGLLFTVWQMSAIGNRWNRHL